MRQDVRSINGALSYLASDLLGSASVALNASGTPTASQLYAPYGGVRYTNGALPTDYGFTGQRADATTGLDYYGARYYDPTVGQFTSADTVLAGGLNRYGYVGDNPISRTDPSGRMSDGYERSGVEGGMSPNDLADPVPSAGVGDGFAAPPAAALIVLGVGIAVLGSVAVLATAGYIVVKYVETHARPDLPTTSGADELSRAYAQYQGQAADTDYWNARTAPHSTPSASSPGGGNHGGGGSGGSGGGSPQTQTGGGSAGAPPGGGGSSVAGPALPDEDGCGCRPVNSRGDPYPSIIDPRTGQEMPFPEGELQRLEDGQEPVEWNNMTRGTYMKEWIDRGYPEPAEGWKPYDIHHILPREFGGTNDFWNLVPILRTIHNGPAPEGVTAWWNAYCPD